MRLGRRALAARVVRTLIGQDYLIDPMDGTFWRFNVDSGNRRLIYHYTIGGVDGELAPLQGLNHRGFTDYIGGDEFPGYNVVSQDADKFILILRF